MLVADEWVELYNPGDAPFPLAGWSLVIGESGEALTGSVAAHGYFVVAASDSFTARYSACSSVQVADDGRLGMVLGDGGASVRLVYSGPEPGLPPLGDAMSYGSNKDACSGVLAPALGRSLHRSALGVGADCDFVDGPPSPCAGPPPPAPTATLTPEPTATAAAGAVLFTEVAYQAGCAD
ncbi:MAG: lamin tail domain-containing protein, partial [Anaerolineae bacterium]